MTPSEGNEFRGKTVEEATEAGLAALNLSEDKVDIEVLSRGSRGLLGFGAEDARVRITPKSPRSATPQPPAKQTPPAPVTKPAPEPKAPVSPEKAPSPAKPAEEPAPSPAPRSDDKEQEVQAVALELLQGMLDRMEINATAHVVEYRGVLDEGQDPPIVLNIEGDDLGILIGRRAETLAAIQYLTRLMINHRLRRWVNIVVDVEGYRARREEQLVRLANRMADRVAGSGRAVALEAMPANERRIIHIALRDNPHVTTESVGEGEHRKVTIVPKE